MRSPVDNASRVPRVSARYDTVAAAAAVPPIAVVVLDRPNPLGGEAVEGPVTVEDACASFVGRKSIAVRHGMTVGELAWFFNKRFVPNDPNNATGKQPVKLVVVPMRGWRRHMSWDQTGLPWVPPSPNVPTATTAMAYVGTCLLEGTNCSEGRGTALPFELVGATWADGSLVDAMRGRHRSVDSGGGGAGEGDARGGGGGSDGIEGVSYGQMVSGGGGGGGIDGVEEANRDDKKGGRFASGGSRASKGKTPAIAPACTYREAYFTPTSGAHQGEFVTGVQVFPLGIDRSLFREGVALLAAMKRLYPGSFRWREAGAAGAASSSSRLKAARRRAESAAVFMSPSKLSSRQDQDRGHAEGGPPFFIDLLTGSGRLREALDGAAGDGAGARVVEELFASWEDELRTFVELRRGFLLYD